MQKNIFSFKNIDIKRNCKFINPKLLFFAGLFIISVLPSWSQVDTADSKGRDFWLTYPPNYHNNYYNNFEDRARLGDSLYIFIVADQPCNVKIDYFDRDGNIYKRNIQIVQTDTIYTFKLCFWDYELKGYNNSSYLLDRAENQCEKVSKTSFHVTSDQDISIYAHNQAKTTSEAMMVMPTDALGYEYIVLGYNSHDISIYTDFDGGSQSTPSQFAVVASEDSTDVTIIPSCPTQYNDMDTQRVRMNKGEVYLVQALLLGNNSNFDLSGTAVLSTKPVAVFSGHQRAMLPITRSGLSPSRDYLLEQLPPVTTWGKRVFLTPYTQLPNMEGSLSDLYRIIAARNGTEVFIDNVKVAILDRGKLYEAKLTKPAVVTASGPILVAQYKKTSSLGSLQDYNPGDPFMMVIPPKEQFMTSYRVINTQAYEFYSGTTYTKVYDYQYITVIVPDTSISTVTIDGYPITKSLFQIIPNSGYYYANKSVTDGIHTVQAGAPIGIYVYGYGGANSYGYVGGMGYTPFDYKKPEIAYNVHCFEVSGTICDTAMYDTGIGEFYYMADSSENVTVNVDGFNRAQGSVNFNARLINVRYDGSAVLYSNDCHQNKANYRIDIPGFTVAVKGTDPNGALPVYYTETRVDKECCTDIVLHNYGKFEQKIRNIRFKKGLFSMKNDSINTIASKQEKLITACIPIADEGVYTDTLMIENECGLWDMAIVTVNAIFDKHPPVITSVGDPCEKEFNLTISDSLISDVGIDAVVFNELVNMTVTKFSGDSTVNHYTLEVTDPYKDAIYDITVTDKKGWTSGIRDTIRGFTLTLSAGTEKSALDFGSIRIGDRICDTITIHNYGLFPFILDDAMVLRNILFSIPQTQFPLEILPGETASLAVCYNPLQYEKGQVFTDTLMISFKCLSMFLPFAGESEPIEREGTLKCGLPVRIISTSVPAGYILGQNIPNPVTGGVTTIIFGIPATDIVELNIYNVQGIRVMTPATGQYNGGVYESVINTQGLPDGVYFYELKTTVTTLTKMFIINN